MRSWVTLKKLFLRQGPHVFQSDLELDMYLKNDLELQVSPPKLHIPPHLVFVVLVDRTQGLCMV